ncbi:MAG: hypothetical protein ACOC35_13735 [Promethearchaeia archaeon]
MTSRKFYTVGQIDATGVRGPHEKELDDFSKAKWPLFKDIDMDEFETIVNKELGAKIEDLEAFSEDWTITIEMFPEVNIHILYTYFGNEFGDMVEAELKFLYSGDRVRLVPGEDSVTYIDVILEFLKRSIENQEPFEKTYDEKTELMEKVLKQRKEPFALLKEKDKDPLEEFLGATVWKTTDGWRIKKELFPEIFVEIMYRDDKGLDVSYSGENLEKIGSYHIELLAIFTINHVLRYITLENQDKELQDICYMMFSRYKTKKEGWKHRNR